jgi:hypothetical protein
MNRTLLATALIAGAAFGSSFAASAQTTSATTTQRDANQQQRDEAHVDRLQAKDMKNGSLSPAEKSRLTAAQNKTSRDITQARTNGINGNPLSASSQRAQADTQRNINQQQRIANGVKDGSLTHHEAAGLERGQSHVDTREARAGANGNVSAGEQRHIVRADNRQSARIYDKRHDAPVKG